MAAPGACWCESTNSQLGQGNQGPSIVVGPLESCDSKVGAWPVETGVGGGRMNQLVWEASPQSVCWGDWAGAEGLELGCGCRRLKGLKAGEAAGVGDQGAGGWGGWGNGRLGTEG